jgi:hypothetical protein
MIVAHVTFLDAGPLDPSVIRSFVQQESIPKWRGQPGLVRKYYASSEDGKDLHGIYLWKSREAAEEAYSKVWRARMLELIGMAPTITYLPCSVVLDNRFDEVLTAEHATV